MSFADQRKKEIWNLLDKKPIVEFDGINTWWFFKPILVLNSLRNPFLSFDEISKKENSRTLKRKVVRYILPKYLLSNELKKSKFIGKKEKFSNENKVLFLTYTTHLFNDKILRIQDILDKLRKDKKIKDLVLFVDPLSKKASKSIKKYENTFYQYLDGDILEKSKEISLKLHNDYKKNIRGHYPEIELNLLFSKEFLRLIIIYYLLFKKIIDKENIKEIVITADTGLQDRAAMAAAFKKNIPVTIVHHGNPGSLPVNYLGKTVVCVKGELYKRNLLSQNATPDQIVLTGTTDYDKLLKHKSEKEKAFRKIVIATSPLVEDNFMTKKDYFSKINNYLNELSGLQNTKIVIKPHPRETNIEKYKEIIKNFDNVILNLEKDKENLYKLLSSSHLLIFFGSGIATESIILGTPALYINLFGENIPYFQLYKKNPAIPELNKDQPIKNAVEEILTNKKTIGNIEKNMNEFIKDYCFKLDGKSKDRIVNTIYKELEK